MWRTRQAHHPRRASRNRAPFLERVMEGSEVLVEPMLPSIIATLRSLRKKGMAGENCTLLELRRVETVCLHSL